MTEEEFLADLKEGWPGVNWESTIHDEQPMFVAHSGALKVSVTIHDDNNRVFAWASSNAFDAVVEWEYYGNQYPSQTVAKLLRRVVDNLKEAVADVDPFFQIPPSGGG